MKTLQIHVFRINGSRKKITANLQMQVTGDR
jgi:hypothetical protein